MDILVTVLPFGRQSSYETEIDLNVKYAKSIIENTGKLEAMVIGISRDHRHICSFLCKNTEEKYEKASLIKQRFRELGVSTIVYIAEAWVKTCKPEDLPNMQFPVRNMPDREEKVIIGYCDGLTSKTVILPIIREKKRVSLGEPSLMDDCTDYLWGDYFES